MSSVSSAKKRTGRPSVDSEAVNVRLVRADLDRLDAWREGQTDQPSRPEAVRRLIEKGLCEATAADSITPDKLNASNDE